MGVMRSEVSRSSFVGKNRYVRSEVCSAVDIGPCQIGI